MALRHATIKKNNIKLARSVRDASSRKKPFKPFAMNDFLSEHRTFKNGPSVQKVLYKPFSAEYSNTDSI